MQTPAEMLSEKIMSSINYITSEFGLSKFEIYGVLQDAIINVSNEYEDPEEDYELTEEEIHELREFAEEYEEDDEDDEEYNSEF